MPLSAEQAVILSYAKDEMGREEQRQDAALYRLNLLRDDGYDQVKSKLLSYFDPDSTITRQVMGRFVNATLNPFAEVIDQISEIYIDDPTRAFRLPDEKGEVKKKDPRLEELSDLYEDVQINQVMERVNRYMNAVNDVIIMPVWRDGKVDVDILTPNVVTVIEDEQNPTRAAAVLIRRKVLNEQRKEATQWTVWTEREHYLLDERLNIVPIEGNEDMVNPYGRIPMIFVHREPTDGGFWDEISGEDLYQCTLIANSRQSLHDFKGFWLNFKQLAVSTSEDIPDGMGLGIEHLLQFPEGAKAQVLDFQVAMKEMDEDLERYIARVVRKYGIDANDFKAQQRGESGRALKIRNSKLERIRKKQIKVLRKAEQDLFEMICHVWEIREKNDGHFNGIELFIDYAPMEQHVDEKELLDIVEKEIKLNLRDLVEVFMERNPDYTEYEDAKTKVIEIIKSNNELRGLVDEPVDEMMRKEA